MAKQLNPRALVPLEQRFWPKVEKTGTCWVWQGATDSHGYGQIHEEPRGHSQAHRVSWELAYGPIPEGLDVLHCCDNPPCVRPTHLFLGTQLDNNLDAINKGRNYWANKTHCLRGHPFDEQNTRHYRGGRHCRSCQTERARAWEKENRKEKVL